MAKRAKKKKFKIQDHNMIPKHTLLKEKEKEQLLAKYHITEKELPKIYKDDAAVRNMNLKYGDVVKIVRKSPTAGTTVYYRVVINE